MSRLKKALYTALVVGSLYGCKDSIVGVLHPRISQTATLENFVDIGYNANLENISQATRKMLRNDSLINTKTISGPSYSEIIRNMPKGNYSFVLGNDTTKIEVPNYLPTVDFSGLQAKLNGRDSLSAVLPNPIDKNPEDNPVPYIFARSLDGKTQVSLNGSNLLIKSNKDSLGFYQIELEFGSQKGGLGKAIFNGMIIRNNFNITSCGEITSPGNYFLQNDLNGTNSCLNIHDTHEVYVDCLGKKITANNPLSGNSVINITNVNKFSLLNCTINPINVPSNQIPDNLYVLNSFYGTITNNTFIGYAPVRIQGSSNLQLSSNNFIKSFYQQDSSNNNIIENNRFDSDFHGAGLIILNKGFGNTIKRNFADGHGNFDDGIIIQSESSDTISENTLQNFWDCGIESTGLIRNTIITNNTIKKALYCGIGGWYWNSMQGNTYSRNRVDSSGTLFTFARRYALLPGESFVYFTDNTFTDNVLTNVNNMRGYATDIEMSQSSFGEVDRSKFVARNNIFSNNDFGTGPGPYIEPRSSIIDGGGNKCGPPSLSQLTSPLVCHNP